MTDPAQFYLQTGLSNFALSTAEVIDSALRARENYLSVFKAKRETNRLEFEGNYGSIPASRGNFRTDWQMDALGTGKILCRKARSTP